MSTTIFTVMSTLAQQYKAINLAQGFPDFPIDYRLSELLKEATMKGFNQYAPMAGLPQLRAAIAENFKKRYDLSIDLETEITITPGATYAIYTAFSAILKKDDEVIVLEPAYDSYIPNILQLGAKPIPIKLIAPFYTVDWEAIRKAITPHTKAIIVNTPHNPTGTIWSKNDWDQLAEIIRDKNITILSDEVYEQLVFDGEKHCSVLEHEELRPKSFALFSFGKVYHNTGWKIGYCIAPPTLTEAFRNIHQYLAFSVNTPAQWALANFLNFHQEQPLHILLQQKRDFFLDLLKVTPFTISAISKGSYFQTASYAQFSDLPDQEFATWLTKEYGVATIPLSPFYSNSQEDKIVRFCFAKKEETLKAAAEKLRNIKI